MRKEVKCQTPYCDNTFVINTNKSLKRKYSFCMKCKREHSYHALVVQVEHNKKIQDIILDAKMFKSASNMADYLGVSFVTMYHWFKKYFNMTYQEFKRKYICKSDKCYLLSIKNSTYSRNDYILKKIRDKRYCACVDMTQKNCIMTNAPITVISSIIRGSPNIDKINDNKFVLSDNGK